MAETEITLSSFKKQFDDQLTCSVCLDKYTDPKMLPCCHTFCMKCIQQLPTIVKDGKYTFNCPECRIYHPFPQGGVTNLPNAFHINSLLDLRRKLTIAEATHQQITASTKLCPQHNDPLKVYCETCSLVICRDCTISQQHNTHKFYLISECYTKHHQQILASLELLKQKMADTNTAVTHLDNTERDVLQQGQHLKEKINTQAQELIDHIVSSKAQLLQQVDTIVQQKTQLLSAQKQQAQKLHTQLNTCQQMIEHSLKEWTQQKILTEKHEMIEQMNTATEQVDPNVFQPIEHPNITFSKIETRREIGLITSTTYWKATLKTFPCFPKKSSTAILTFQSQDGSPFSLPPSLVSSTLSSPANKHSVKCNITQTQKGKYSIKFTPFARHDQLIVQLGGVTLRESPFALPVIVPPEKPVNSAYSTGLGNPWGIAVSSDNKMIIVVERWKDCITILNKEGKTLRTLCHGKLKSPSQVAFAKDGHILVTDEHRLQKLTLTGACVKSVGSGEWGNHQLQLNNPKGIAVDLMEGQIFVADNYNKRIQVFTNDLKFLRTIVLSYDPCDVVLDNEGYLYVAEWRNHSIAKLTTTGQHINRFGLLGSAPGKLHGPSSLAIYDNNILYICEVGNHRVSAFDTNGTFLCCFGKKGSGECDLKQPYGIAVDKNGYLYISDTANDRIVMY